MEAASYRSLRCGRSGFSICLYSLVINFRVHKNYHFCYENLLVELVLNSRTVSALCFLIDPCEAVRNIRYLATNNYFLYYFSRCVRTSLKCKSIFDSCERLKLSLSSCFLVFFLYLRSIQTFATFDQCSIYCSFLLRRCSLSKSRVFSSRCSWSYWRSFAFYFKARFYLIFLQRRAFICFSNDKTSNFMRFSFIALIRSSYYLFMRSVYFNFVKSGFLCGSTDYTIGSFLL